MNEKETIASQSHHLEALCQFYLSEKDIASTTMKLYKIILKQYIAYLTEHKIEYANTSDIINYMRSKHNLYIGERTAERIKIQVGAATEDLETPPEDTLEPNSSTANLMLRTISNDGSNDNILDLANCFNIKLPITVTANSSEVIINTESDYDKVEYIFDEEYDDVNVLNITYPVTIIQDDYTEVVVNNNSELTNFAATCNGENILDDDI